MQQRPLLNDQIPIKTPIKSNSDENSPLLPKKKKETGRRKIHPLGEITEGLVGGFLGIPIGDPGESPPGISAGRLCHPREVIEDERRGGGGGGRDPETGVSGGGGEPLAGVASITIDKGGDGRVGAANRSQIAHPERRQKEKEVKRRGD